MFRLKYPKVCSKITLSKIVRLKQDLMKTFLKGKDTYVQLYSVAHAWVLFERLILKNVVRKHNRRIYLAICLLISIKLVEDVGEREAKKKKFGLLEKDVN